MNKYMPIAIYFIVLSVLSLIYLTLGADIALVRPVFLLGSLGGVFLFIMEWLNE